MSNLPAQWFIPMPTIRDGSRGLQTYGGGRRAKLGAITMCRQSSSRSISMPSQPWAIGRIREPAASDGLR